MGIDMEMEMVMYFFLYRDELLSGHPHPYVLHRFVTSLAIPIPVIFDYYVCDALSKWATHNRDGDGDGDGRVLQFINLLLADNVEMGSEFHRRWRWLSQRPLKWNTIPMDSNPHAHPHLHRHHRVGLRQWLLWEVKYMPGDDDGNGSRWMGYYYRCLQGFLAARRVNEVY